MKVHPTVTVSNQRLKMTDEIVLDPLLPNASFAKTASPMAIVVVPLPIINEHVAPEIGFGYAQMV